MKLRDFSKEDFQMIEAAVTQAESKISGEIVPVIVDQSGSYSLSVFRGSTLSAIMSFFLLYVFDRYGSPLDFFSPLIYLLTLLLSGTLTALLIFMVPSLKRMLAGKDQLKKTCHQKAESLFLSNEVFNTRKRTGILIFISLLERIVIVKADKGINEVVSQEKWDNLVANLIQDIRGGEKTKGIVKAIEECGKTILLNGFEKDANDINELENKVRTA